MEYNDCLRLHLDVMEKTANCTFCGLSSDIQNQIINWRDHETVDLWKKSQLLHVFQFVDEMEKPLEMFFGQNVDASKDRRAALLMEEIWKFVNSTVAKNPSLKFMTEWAWWLDIWTKCKQEQRRFLVLLCATTICALKERKKD